MVTKQVYPKEDTLSAEAIHKQVPNCPDSLAKAIAQLPKQDQTEALNALRTISKIKEGDQLIKRLDNSNLRRVFLGEPNEFINLVTEMGTDIWPVLCVLRDNEKICQLFQNGPNKVTSAFKTLLETTEGNRDLAFYSLGKDMSTDFENWLNGKTSTEQFIFAIFQQYDTARALVGHLEGKRGDQLKHKLDGMPVLQLAATLAADIEIDPSTRSAIRESILERTGSSTVNSVLDRYNIGIALKE